MTIQVQTDEELVQTAMRLGGHPSREDAVDAALSEYVKRRDRRRILELAGKLEPVADYDYKAGRVKR